MALGIAPDKDQKGIILVTPTITLTSAAYGVCNNVVPIKHRHPMIKESTILPPINPMKVLWVKRKLLIRRLAVSVRKHRPFFRLSGKFFLTCQYINGNNESDDKIPKTLQNIDYAQRYCHDHLDWSWSVLCYLTNSPVLRNTYQSVSDLTAQLRIVIHNLC